MEHATAEDGGIKMLKKLFEKTMIFLVSFIIWLIFLGVVVNTLIFAAPLVAYLSGSGKEKIVILAIWIGLSVYFAIWTTYLSSLEESLPASPKPEIVAKGNTTGYEFSCNL